MNFILNIIWLIFSGIWLAIAYFVAGVIACLLIITIPAGVASFRMAGFGLWPFGRSVVQPVGGVGGFSTVGNVIWFLVAGLWLALSHLTTAAVQAVTIIGIPLAIANVRMIPITCFPFGRRVVDSDAIPLGWEPMIKF